MKRVRTLIAAIVLLLAAPAAWACTLCHTPAARELREAVFGPEFAGTLMALALPLPLLLAAVWLASRDGRSEEP